MVLVRRGLSAGLILVILARLMIVLLDVAGEQSAVGQISDSSNDSGGEVRHVILTLPFDLASHQRLETVPDMSLAIPHALRRSSR